MEPITVLIAEDNLAYAQGIKSLLEEDISIQVAGIAGTGKILLEMLREKGADVVMMDIQMPEMDGIAATKIIHDAYPGVKVLALTMLTAPFQLMAIMKAGARGYLNKDSTGKELRGAVHAIHAGIYTYCDSTSSRIIQALGKSNLVLWNEQVEFDELEIEIIRLTCKEYKGEKVAAELFLTRATYHRYLKNIMQKMNVRNKVALVVYAARHGLAGN